MKKRKQPSYIFICVDMWSAKVKNLYSKSYLQNNHLFMSFFILTPFLFWGFVANCGDMFCKNANKRFAK